MKNCSFKRGCLICFWERNFFKRVMLYFIDFRNSQYPLPIYEIYEHSWLTPYSAFTETARKGKSKEEGQSSSNFKSNKDVSSRRRGPSSSNCCKLFPIQTIITKQIYILPIEWLCNFRTSTQFLVKILKCLNQRRTNKPAELGRYDTVWWSTSVVYSNNQNTLKNWISSDDFLILQAWLCVMFNVIPF